MSLEQTSSLIGVVFIFLLVLYGSYVVSKKVAKMSLRDSRSKYMKFHDHIMIGQDRYVAIISVGDRYFMVGSCENGINMLAELEEKDLKAENGPAGYAVHPSFKEIIKKLGKDKNTKA